jgi:hypothetical protein
VDIGIERPPYVVEPLVDPVPAEWDEPAQLPLPTPAPQREPEKVPA